MTDRKKVLMLIKGLGAGGAERLLTQGSPYFDRDRYDYEIAYFLPWKNALVPELREAGLNVVCLDQRRPFDPRGPYRLARLLQERRPDVPFLGLATREGGTCAARPHRPAPRLGRTCKRLHEALELGPVALGELAGTETACSDTHHAPRSQSAAHYQTNHTDQLTKAETST